jgi:hypothetical protein
MSTSSTTSLIEKLAQAVVKYINESDVDIDELEGDFTQPLIDWLQSENLDLPDHESALDLLNETIDSLLED